MADLRSEAWVLSPENYELREATLEACRKAGFTPHVVLDGGEMDTLLRLVAAGVGISLVPRLAVQAGDGLSVLNIRDQQLYRSIGLVWRSDRLASPAARTLREFLVEHLCQSFQQEIAPEASS
jgi:DNA-binding transcriptional LysR family regulator